MNVVIWARVSSREPREGYSIDAQLQANRERAQKNGWTIVREFLVAEFAKRGAERTVFPTKKPSNGFGARCKAHLRTSLACFGTNAAPRPNAAPN